MFCYEKYSDELMPNKNKRKTGQIRLTTGNKMHCNRLLGDIRISKELQICSVLFKNQTKLFQDYL